MFRKLILPALSAILAFGLAATAAAQTNPQVVIKTTKGDITIELDPVKAPVTVKNFLSYVDEKFYDGTIFHRVIKGFMIQGGGLTPDYKEKKEKAGDQERGRERPQQSPRARSPWPGARPSTAPPASSISTTPTTSSLDGLKYAVFGRVIQGWTSWTPSPRSRRASSRATRTRPASRSRSSRSGGRRPSSAAGPTRSRRCRNPRRRRPPHGRSWAIRSSPSSTFSPSIAVFVYGVVGLVQRNTARFAVVCGGLVLYYFLVLHKAVLKEIQRKRGL